MISPSEEYVAEVIEVPDSSGTHCEVICLFRVHMITKGKGNYQRRMFSKSLPFTCTRQSRLGASYILIHPWWVTSISIWYGSNWMWVTKELDSRSDRVQNSCVELLLVSWTQLFVLQRQSWRTQKKTIKKPWKQQFWLATVAQQTFPSESDETRILKQRENARQVIFWSWPSSFSMTYIYRSI